MSLSSSSHASRPAEPSNLSLLKEYLRLCIQVKKAKKKLLHLEEQSLLCSQVVAGEQLSGRIEHNNRHMLTYMSEQLARSTTVNRLFGSRQTAKLMLHQGINATEHGWMGLVLKAGLVVHEETGSDDTRLILRFRREGSHEHEKKQDLRRQTTKSMLDEEALRYGMNMYARSRVKPGEDQEARSETVWSTAGDHTFSVELKAYIRGQEPVPEHALPYFRSFFCDLSLSPTLRQWLWEQRIGNRIRMTRSLFNNLLVRGVRDAIEVATEEIMVEDLIRTCSAIPSQTESKRVYENLKRLLSLFEVGFGEQTYRPDIGYVQGMSFIMHQLFRVTRGDVYSTFSMFCNLILADQLLSDLYSFDKELVALAHQVDPHIKRIRKLVKKFHAGLKADNDSVFELTSSSLYTLFASSLPFEAACIFWDMYLVFGPDFVYRFTANVCGMMLKFLKNSATLGSVGAKENLSRLDIQAVWRQMVDRWEDV